jgi:DNA-binding transcriptional MerR regulator
MASAERRDRPDLSQKLYYTIGEVSELTGVKAHVLRYWENEFPQLRPRKGRGGSRRYRRGDIELLLTIRELLYEQGYRIEGARKHLEEQRRQGTGERKPAPQMSLGFADLDPSEQIAQLRAELEEIRALVRKADEAAG